MSHEFVTPIFPQRLSELCRWFPTLTRMCDTPKKIETAHTKRRYLLSICYTFGILSFYRFPYEESIFCTTKQPPNPPRTTFHLEHHHLISTSSSFSAASLILNIRIINIKPHLLLLRLAPKLPFSIPRVHPS